MRVEVVNTHLICVLPVVDAVHVRNAMFSISSMTRTTSPQRATLATPGHYKKSSPRSSLNNLLNKKLGHALFVQPPFRVAAGQLGEIQRGGHVFDGLPWEAGT